MHTVTSKDGSSIAYDRYGEGPVVILLPGALGHRGFSKMRELAELLAPFCTVVNPDRRGRGDSTHAGPYDLQREIEDIDALIQAHGDRASLWGWSSGGALALRAGIALNGVERVSVYEVPFMVTPGLKHPTPDYAQRIEQLVAQDRRDALVQHFMRNAVGMPAPFAALMRLMPMYRQLKANAHTLGHDWAALGAHTMYGAPLDAQEWAATPPAQVVYGSKSPRPLRDGSTALADVLPDARLDVLDGVSHNVDMRKLAPVLLEFVTRPAGRPLAAR